MNDSGKSWHFNKKEQHKMKRDILLQVAAECFNQKGITGTSLKDVAKKLEITDAALYYYVKNKEELVTLCYQRALDLGENALNIAIDRGENNLDKLQHYIRLQIDCVCGPDGPVAILSEVPSLKPEHREEIVVRARAHTKKIVKLIEDGVKEGSIVSSNPLVTADAVLGALNWIPKWYKKDADMPAEMIAESFVQTFTAGIAAK